MRKTLADDALKIARHVGYENAGTVEFLLDAEVRVCAQPACVLLLQAALVLGSIGCLKRAVLLWVQGVLVGVVFVGFEILEKRFCTLSV